jgi:hypothetical protein
MGKFSNGIKCLDQQPKTLVGKPYIMGFFKNIEV